MAEKFDPYHKWLGIPPHEQPPHHYRLLGVGLFEADPDVIEGAADRQMAHVQTHKAGPHSAVSQKLLNELSAAKLCLLNPKKKPVYDEQLRQRMAATAIAVPVAAAVGEESASADDAADESQSNEMGFAIASSGRMPRASAAAPRVRIVQAKKKKNQQMLLAVFALGAVLMLLLALAAWKLSGSRAENDGADPSTVASLDPQHKSDPRENEPDKKDPEKTDHPTQTGQEEKKPTPKPVAKEPPPKQPEKKPPTVSPPAGTKVPPQNPKPSPPKPEPKPNKPKTNDRPPSDLTASGGGIKQKLPIPSDDELQGERQQVRKTLKGEYAAAKTAADKAALADRLYKAAQDPTDKPPARFALFSEARQLSMEAGRVELLDSCLKDMAKWFAVDLLQLKAESFPAAFKAAGNDADHRRQAEESLLLVDEAIEAERYELADKFGDLARSEAAKSKDTDLKKSAVEKEAKVRRLLKDQEEVAAARKKLEQTDGDPEANLTLGKHLCLVREEWDEGLPHLVKGSDPELARIANLELAASESAEGHGALASAWWELAATAPAADKEACKTRARHWYELALPSLTGAEKAAAETRLGIKSSSPAGPADTAVTPVDALLKKAQTAAKAKVKKLNASSIVGTNRASKEFTDAVKEGGILVGFRLRIRKDNVPFVSQLQPVYLTASGNQPGAVHGRANRNDSTIEIIAREGYAVGAVTARANPDRNNNNLTGLGVTFMKITAKGLSKKDSYDSDWLGDSNKNNAQSLGVPGKAIVGIFGYEREDNSFPTGLGVVVLP